MNLVRFTAIFALLILFSAPLQAEEPPRIVFDDLMHKFVMAHDTKFTMWHLSAVFIPKACGEAQDDAPLGCAVWAKIADASGKECYQIAFKAKGDYSPYCVLIPEKVFERTDGLYSKRIQEPSVELSDTPLIQSKCKFYLEVEGDYTLDFYYYLNGEFHKFYTFPFSVVKLTDEDGMFPDAPRWFLNGAWEDWIYFEYGDDPNRLVGFYYWLRDYSCGKSKFHYIDILITNKAGDVIEEDSAVEIPEKVWTKQHGMIPIKAKDFLATDDDYTLTITINDELYGTWHFAVRDGQFAEMGRTRRGEADPLTFVEGLESLWWYEREH